MSPVSEAPAEDDRVKLLRNIEQQLPQLEDLLRETSTYSVADRTSRDFPWQAMTLRICTALQNLLPERPMNPAFCRMVMEGAGREIDPASSVSRIRQRVVIDAFVRAHFFLEIACRKGKDPNAFSDDSDRDWITLLKLFEL
jgi:hypothetical protein